MLRLIPPRRPPIRGTRRSLLVGCSVVAVIAVLSSQSPSGESPIAGRPEALPSEPPTLQLTSPGPTGLATYNQVEGAKAYTARIDDAAMRVRAARVRFAGLAKGLRSVAIVIGGVWTVAVPDPAGRFEAFVDLSTALTGPLVVDVYGWDSPPDNHAFKTALNLRVHLFVEGGQDGTPPVERPAGHPAHGRTLVWSEPFDRLSPKIWHAGPKPDGQEYGAAAFLGYDAPEGSPYTIMGGFLRIRATHMPDRIDPAGFGRTWVTGHLSTGFPDGSASGAFRKGYFEARMMLPAGPGCWSAFWLLDQSGIRTSVTEGAVEVDVIEGYGHATTSYVATEHDWPAPSAKSVGYKREQRNIVGIPDYALAFHDYGVEITDDEMIFYFDGAAKFRAPLFRHQTVSPFFMMLTLAISQDWPVTVPPAGYYDLWIDQVRVYQ
jgi:hypothetical protein